jgi:predicted  nucleic acid-binding Zn-ribbon protein
MTVIWDPVSDLPATREACRARLAELHHDVQAIRTKIATADLERQQRRGRIDPQQFQAWRTALRDRQAEIERLTRHMATLPSRRETFKDRLIAVLRADYNDVAWQAAVDRAHRLVEG